MLFLTATTIGLLAGMTRTIVSIMAVALLVVAAFGAASLFGSTSALDLLVAILGYNLGLAGLMAGVALAEKAKLA